MKKTKKVIELRPETPDQEKCDFCSVEHCALWAYPTEDFDMTPVIPIPLPFPIDSIQSMGTWFACSTCRELIESNQRHALLQRAAKAFGPDPFHVIQDLHQRFFKHRTGPGELRVKPKGTS